MAYVSKGLFNYLKQNAKDAAQIYVFSIVVKRIVGIFILGPLFYISGILIELGSRLSDRAIANIKANKNSKNTDLMLAELSESEYDESDDDVPLKPRGPYTEAERKHFWEADHAGTYLLTGVMPEYKPLSETDPPNCPCTPLTKKEESTLKSLENIIKKSTEAKK